MEESHETVPATSANGLRDSAGEPAQLDVSAGTDATWYVPRVVHLGYFDAVLDGIRASLTFDQLRLRLITVATDLARFYGRPLPSQRTDPSVFWTTTRDALEGLMRSGFVATRPLPSRKEAALAQADTKYTLTPEGRLMLSSDSVATQRETLGRALFGSYAYFRRYLHRLQQGPLFFPELSELEFERLLRDGWAALAAELVNRTNSSSAHTDYDVGDLATSLREFVDRRFESTGRRRSTPTRKDRLDATLDGIVGFVSRAEGVGADPTTLGTLHEWGRQLFLIGSSRYVAGSAGGSLHWIGCVIDESSGSVDFRRKTIRDSAPEVIGAVAQAYRLHLREGTRLVEFYRLRATAAFLAGVSNDLVDRVAAAMILGELPNPFGLQPATGAQWTPPPSERALRIRDRRYNLVSFLREPKEE